MKLLIFFRDVLSIPWQDSDPYGETGNFLTNFFFGPGLGYWIYFLILAIAAAIWLYYDSARRELKVPAWRLGGLIAVGLLLPSLLFKMGVREGEVYQYFDLKGQIEYLMNYQDTTDWRHKVDDLELQLRDNFHPLTGLIEPIMLLGILGGIGGPVLAAAYYITFQGAAAGEQIPHPEAFAPPPSPAPDPSPQVEDKPKANAWLVTSDGVSYQLNQGATTLGRSAHNDIQLRGDTTISKAHAKIIEQNNHFRLHDLGSTNGSKVNQRPVRQPALLVSDDEIQLGDHTTLRFVTAQK